METDYLLYMAKTTGLFIKIINEILHYFPTFPFVLLQIQFTFTSSHVKAIVSVMYVNVTDLGYKDIRKQIRALRYVIM